MAEFRGAQELVEKGEFAAGSKKYEAALAGLDETKDTHDTRYLVLSHLLDSRSAAFKADPEDISQLRAARDVLSEYVKEIAQKYPSDVELQGRAPATERLTALNGALKVLDPAETTPPPSSDLENGTADAAGDETEEGPETPQEPAPADAVWTRRQSTLQAIGAASVAAGAGFVGMTVAGLMVGKQAEEEGRALTLQAPTLSQEALAPINERGERANLIAGLGGAFSAIFLGTGIGLIVVGRRPPKTSATSLSPSFGRQSASLVLQIRI
jgi:hypothetical protein